MAGAVQRPTGPEVPLSVPPCRTFARRPGFPRGRNWTLHHWLPPIRRIHPIRVLSPTVRCARKQSTRAAGFLLALVAVAALPAAPALAGPAQATSTVARAPGAVEAGAG